MSKKELGQFYTITNPFTLEPFITWLNIALANSKNKCVLEPFAGSNNIPRMLDGVVINWSCYDIDPSVNNCYPSIKIEQRDTIKNYPQGYNVVITNPPYLGKSAAKRSNIECGNLINDDLYKDCLDVMLNYSDYVAAIIPETFIVSSYNKDRLTAVISLTCKMFDDTACPVCLALFNPETSSDFSIYRMDKLLGTFSQLSKYNLQYKSSINWKFNDPNGEIGVRCIDNFIDSSDIRFGLGSDIIDSSKIKNSSRTITRISGLPTDINIEKFLECCNLVLNEYRKNTKDVFLAPFKCLREDGLYRRRLDFKTIKNILNYTYENVYFSDRKNND